MQHIKGISEFDSEVPLRVKLRSGKIYLCKTTNGWYRLYRQGQRSWHSVCVVPNTEVNWEENGGITVKGNSSSIVPELETIVTVYAMFMLNNETEYRKALMSIVATGRMDASFNFEIIQKEEKRS